MTDGDSGSNDDPTMTTVPLEIPQAFLDDLDATWRAKTSRPEASSSDGRSTTLSSTPRSHARVGKTSPPANTS